MTLAIVDVSSSFEGSLRRVQADLRKLLDAGVALSEETIVFGGSARLVPTSMLVSTTTGIEVSGGGTEFRPVLHLLAQLDAKQMGPAAVRLYTDGQFSDMALEEARELLSARGNMVLVELD